MHELPQTILDNAEYESTPTLHELQKMNEPEKRQELNLTSRQQALLCLNGFPRWDYQRTREEKRYCSLSREQEMECPYLSKDAIIIPHGDGQEGIYRLCHRDEPSA